jgi:two-component system CheB/CheR fusion protein
MIAGSADVAIAVRAMKAGASNFIEKPVGGGELLASIKRAIEQSRDSRRPVAWKETAANHLADLTPRQREIMALVLAGAPSKNITPDLGMSQRTGENHRASIMKTTGSKWVEVPSGAGEIGTRRALFRSGPPVAALRRITCR